MRAREAIARQADQLRQVAQKQVVRVRDAGVVREAYGTAERQAENIIAKVVETGKGAEKAADEKVETIKKTVQGHVENAEELAKESSDGVRISADQIVMNGKEQVDKAQGYTAHKIKDAELALQHRLGLLLIEKQEDVQRCGKAAAHKRTREVPEPKSLSQQITICKRARHGVIFKFIAMNLLCGFHTKQGFEEGL
ncbi:MAG: hypothetical protein J3Q66DRAFT_419020 [Benniella sp.]|nr:MAG: hypothetical protein J3Q66DRAFT_419020 [Benniella sp.]